MSEKLINNIMFGIEEPEEPIMEGINMVHENSLPVADRDEAREQYGFPPVTAPPSIDDLMETVPMISQKAIWQNAEMHGWHNPPCDLNTDLLLIHSEISEACEAARKGVMHMSTGNDSVEEELADAVIRILHVGQKNGFDIAKAVQKKHMRNISRPMRHGNKLF